MSIYELYVQVIYRYYTSVARVFVARLAILQNLFQALNYLFEIDSTLPIPIECLLKLYTTSSSPFSSLNGRFRLIVAYSRPQEAQRNASLSDSP